MRSLVTGAGGFVGQALVRRLLATPDQSVVAAVRGGVERLPQAVERGFAADLAADTNWRAGLEGVDTVYHLAARVHVMNDGAADPLAEFRRANVAGTLALARQFAEVGGRRLVFVSSVKVNGEQTLAGRPFSEDDAPAPADSYGVSKLEAEEGLRRVAEETGLEVVVVRPPLVYGPGVKANFLRMLKWVHRGIPLPFGAIENRRSLVALDNLVDLLVTSGRHREAAGQTFLVSDGEDLSTTRLLERLGAALGRPARLLPVPPSALRAAFSLAGKGDLARRLCGSLQVDIRKARTLLGWQPPHSVDEALETTARHFVDAQRQTGIAAR